MTRQDIINQNYDLIYNSSVKRLINYLVNNDALIIWKTSTELLVDLQLSGQARFISINLQNKENELAMLMSADKYNNLEQMLHAHGLVEP